jgi:hypothetical protein
VSPAVKRGLQVAKHLLRMGLATPTTQHVTDADLLEALAWIAHQEAIDAKRRGPRR